MPVCLGYVLWRVRPACYSAPEELKQRNSRQDDPGREASGLRWRRATDWGFGGISGT